MLTLEGVTSKFAKAGEKIMVNGGAFNPFMMFYTNRKGWSVENDVFVKTDWTSDFKKLGMTIMIQDKHSLSQKLSHNIIFENDHFIIYKP